MKCKVFRNFETDTVEKVLNSQGNESSLFEEALASLQDQEQALNVWATANTAAFIAYSKGQVFENREPSLEEVMKYVNNVNTSAQLNSQDITELTNNLESIPTTDSGDFLTRLQRTFFDSDGVFRVVRDRLKRSGFYSDTEINNILTFPSVRANIKDFIGRLRNTLKLESNIENLFNVNDSSGNVMVQDSSETLDIGKFKNISTEDFNDYLLANIKSFSTQDDLMLKIQNLDNSVIRDFILDSSDNILMVKDLINNSKSIPVLTEVNGILVPKMANDLSSILSNTIRIGESNEEFTQAVSVVRAVPTTQWQNPEIMLPLLKAVEMDAASHLIDLTGLSDTYLTRDREEVLGLLDVVDDFLLLAEMSSIGQTDIYNLSADISEFFGENDSTIEKSIPISETEKGRNLSLVETSKNEIELFDEDGFIKFRDNVYQRVVPFESFNALLDETYQSMLDDITILPQDILESASLWSGGKYNLSYLGNSKNEGKIKADLKKYIAQNLDSGIQYESSAEYDSLQQLEFYKKLLDVPNLKLVETPGEFGARQTVEISESQEEYITSDFVSDFYRTYLQEKVTNSPVFNNALNYFEITDRGIGFTSSNPLIQNQVKSILSGNPMLSLLETYSSLSKNPTLAFMVPAVQPEQLLDIQNRRNYAVNFPSTVTKGPAMFSRVNNNTIVLKNSISEFLKFPDGIYELVNQFNGVSVFAKITAVTDPNFYVFNASQPNTNNFVEGADFESTENDISIKNKSNVSNKTSDLLLENLMC